MSKLLSEVRSWFERYFEEHVPDEMKNDRMIRLKNDHSRRVSVICGSLADDIGWDANGHEDAVVMGLLHDVGRFAQFSRYKTFSDKRSENHAEAGYEILRSSGLFDSIDRSRADGILTAVRYHNLREIPKSAADEELPYICLLRDADKLDIFGIFDEAIRDDSFATRLVDALNIEIDGPVNPAALADVMNGETVENDHIRTGMDFLVMLISWIFDLNYQPSRQRLADSGTLDLIVKRLPDSPEVRKAVAHALSSFSAEGK